MNKTYILQKDIPEAQATDEYRYEGLHGGYVNRNRNTMVLPKGYVENNPSWFKLKEEPFIKNYEFTISNEEDKVCVIKDGVARWYNLINQKDSFTDYFIDTKVYINDKEEVIPETDERFPKYKEEDMINMYRIGASQATDVMYEKISHALNFIRDKINNKNDEDINEAIKLIMAKFNKETNG